MIVTNETAYPRSNPRVAWRVAYHGAAMTQPSDQRTVIDAESVARSGPVTRSIATTTVQRIGEKPRTSRNGMLAPWTRTTDVRRPNRRASAGWAMIATIVP